MRTVPSVSVLRSSTKPTAPTFLLGRKNFFNRREEAIRVAQYVRIHHDYDYFRTLADILHKIGSTRVGDLRCLYSQPHPDKDPVAFTRAMRVVNQIADGDDDFFKSMGVRAPSPPLVKTKVLAQASPPKVDTMDSDNCPTCGGELASNGKSLFCTTAPCEWHQEVKAYLAPSTVGSDPQEAQKPTKVEPPQVGSKVLKHEGGKWNLYTSDGTRKLGTHPSKKRALAQEQAIEISKHKRGKDMSWLAAGRGAELVASPAFPLGKRRTKELKEKYLSKSAKKRKWTQSDKYRAEHLHFTVAGEGQRPEYHVMVGSEVVHPEHAVEQIREHLGGWPSCPHCDAGEDHNVHVPGFASMLFRRKDKSLGRPNWVNSPSAGGIIHTPQGDYHVLEALDGDGHSLGLFSVVLNGHLIWEGHSAREASQAVQGHVAQITRESYLGGSLPRPPVIKSLYYQVKSEEGQPCTPGHTESRDGCVPSSGEEVQGELHGPLRYDTETDLQPEEPNVHKPSHGPGSNQHSKRPHPEAPNYTPNQYHSEGPIGPSSSPMNYGQGSTRFDRRYPMARVDKILANRPIVLNLPTVDPVALVQNVTSEEVAQATELSAQEASQSQEEVSPEQIQNVGSALAVGLALSHGLVDPNTTNHINQALPSPRDLAKALGEFTEENEAFWKAQKKKGKKPARAGQEVSQAIKVARSAIITTNASLNIASVFTNVMNGGQFHVRQLFRHVQSIVGRNGVAGFGVSAKTTENIIIIASVLALSTAGLGMLHDTYQKIRRANRWLEEEKKRKAQQAGGAPNPPVLLNSDGTPVKRPRGRPRKPPGAPKGPYLRKKPYFARGGKSLEYGVKELEGAPNTLTVSPETLDRLLKASVYYAEDEDTQAQFRVLVCLCLGETGGDLDLALDLAERGMVALAGGEEKEHGVRVPVLNREKSFPFDLRVKSQGQPCVQGEHDDGCITATGAVSGQASHETPSQPGPVRQLADSPVTVNSPSSGETTSTGQNEEMGHSGTSFEGETDVSGHQQGWDENWPSPRGFVVDPSLPKLARKHLSLFARAMEEHSNITPKERWERLNAAQKVFGNMPEEAIQRFNEHLHDGFKVGKTCKEAALKLADDIKNSVGWLPGEELKFKINAHMHTIGGAYYHNPTTQRASVYLGGAMHGYMKLSQSIGMALGLAGDPIANTAREIYAHEFGHVVDGVEVESDAAGNKTMGKWKISGSPEWLVAWGEEIASSKTPFHTALTYQLPTKHAKKLSRLTDYAASSPQEGVAEFSRMLYSGHYRQADVKKKFPRCWNVFARLGLIKGEQPALETKALNSESLNVPELFEVVTGLNDLAGFGSADVVIHDKGPRSVKPPVLGGRPGKEGKKSLPFVPARP